VYDQDDAAFHLPPTKYRLKAHHTQLEDIGFRLLQFGGLDTALLGQAEFLVKSSSAACMKFSLPLLRLFLLQVLYNPVEVLFGHRILRPEGVNMALGGTNIGIGLLGKAPGSSANPIENQIRITGIGTTLFRFSFGFFLIINRFARATCKNKNQYQCGFCHPIRESAKPPGCFCGFCVNSVRNPAQGWDAFSAQFEKGIPTPRLNGKFRVGKTTPLPSSWALSAQAVARRFAADYLLLCSS